MGKWRQTVNSRDTRFIEVHLWLLDVDCTFQEIYRGVPLDNDPENTVLGYTFGWFYSNTVIHCYVGQGFHVVCALVSCSAR